MLKEFSLVLLAGAASFAQISDLSGERVRAHVKFLANDLLEGRGVGTRGEKLATEYIATQFALIAPSRPAIRVPTSSECRWWAQPPAPTRRSPLSRPIRPYRFAGWTIS